MLPGSAILLASFGYLSLLFAIAYWGDKRADRHKSLIDSPYIYALSIAVYCTSWTFYGSVGRAATAGIGFLPIYLGPTLTFILAPFVLRKIIRISKANRITSIADFISSRYGKSQVLGGLVTVIAVVGIMPYISLQLKAVSATFGVLLQYPETAAAAGAAGLLGDTALYVALVLAAFSILFGTRHIDATEHHEGMVAAVAFESVVKLFAFVAAGLFVAYAVFSGFGDLFGRAAADPNLARLFTFGPSAGNWVTLTMLAMAAIVCLPRQFQVLVVENVRESHLDKAIWLFPLYLLAINLFVLPIAFAGLVRFSGGAVEPDNFVLALPLAEGQPLLAMLVFIGGLSAATAMVIVETIALSTMISNDLVMPVLLRFAWLHLAERRDLSGLVLGIRRGSIVLILLLGYLYFRLSGESYTLVTIGLVSFVAAAQFAPAIVGGIYWKGASRRGAIAGLSAGFLVWIYTLLLPSFERSGWLPAGLIDQGMFGIALLKPYALFGLDGLDHISHALFWSMLANIGGYVAVSLVDRQSGIERIQATRFVEVFRQTAETAGGRLWRGKASLGALRQLAERFIGPAAAEQAFVAYGRRRRIDLAPTAPADADTVQFAERLLAGAIGAASARVMIASVVKAEGMTIEEMMEILDEASHVIEYSRQLEQKSRALEQATAELKAANEQLKELDRLKDEFLSTVTHELRTPLTSIRSFSEILHDNPDLEAARRDEFLGIIIRESERLTRLINQVLDLARIESGRMDWQLGVVDLKQVVEEALAAMAQLFKEKDLTVEVEMPSGVPPVIGDRDRLTQVAFNLLSNAQKFCEPHVGRIRVRLASGGDGVTVSVADNGPGIPSEQFRYLFEKFHRVQAGGTGNPTGSGLGLAISRRIVEHLNGRIWAESQPDDGTVFTFTIPAAPANP
jgi:Na+/proline symporter/signal transduction histidine kinase